MNYGGMYRNTPQHLVQQAQAENLTIVDNLVVTRNRGSPILRTFKRLPMQHQPRQLCFFMGKNFTPATGDIWDC